MNHTSITLYCTEGSADKQYSVNIQHAGNDLFHVICFNGRRGGSQKARPQTVDPVSLADAQTMYAGIVAKKKREGYTEDVSGTPYALTEKAGLISGWVPALLSPIEQVDIDTYMRDDAWGASEKHDGERRGLELAFELGQAETRGMNKKGLYTALPACWAEITARLPKDTILDGEHVEGDILQVFDVVRLGGKDMTPLSFEEREKALLSLEPLLGTSKDGAVVIVRTERGEERKRALLERVTQEKGEGIVFVRLDAAYAPGEASSAQSAVRIKFKLQESATCIVTAVSKTKRSVGVSVLDAQGALVNVGNVTIPANKAVPAVGDLAEVRFLYMFAGGSLFQPVYLGPRKDQAREDALLRKILRIKRKSTVAGKDEDEAVVEAESEEAATA